MWKFDDFSVLNGYFNCNKWANFSLAFQIIGGVHGNDAVTTEIILEFIQYLLSHSNLDDNVNRIVKGYSLHFLPALNRDGTGLNNAGDCSLNGKGKLNRAGIDLETDFNSSPNAHVQPETQSIMTWMNQRKFLFSLDLRASDENILIPLVNSTFQSTAKWVPFQSPEGEPFFLFKRSRYASAYFICQLVSVCASRCQCASASALVIGDLSFSLS